MLKKRKYINPKILTSIYFAIFQSHLYDMWILINVFVLNPHDGSFSIILVNK